MKLFWYIFYHSLITSGEHGKSAERSYIGAVREISLVLFVPAITLLIILIDRSGVWPFIVMRWPYDYGDIHSKNLFAPTGVLAICVFILIYWRVKKYFLFSKELETFSKPFRGKESKKEKKVGSWLGVFLFFYFCFCGVVSFYNTMLAFILFLGLFLYVEYKIRIRFF